MFQVPNKKLTWFHIFVPNRVMAKNINGFVIWHRFNHWRIEPVWIFKSEIVFKGTVLSGRWHCSIKFRMDHKYLQKYHRRLANLAPLWLGSAKLRFIFSPNRNKIFWTVEEAVLWVFKNTIFVTTFVTSNFSMLECFTDIKSFSVVVFACNFTVFE